MFAAGALLLELIIAAAPLAGTDAYVFLTRAQRHAVEVLPQFTPAQKKD